uniref:nesprin-1-like n=1 Tax=Myxine glutinosa TaxID=7769 RepID=UPI00358E66DF
MWNRLSSIAQGVAGSPTQDDGGLSPQSTPQHSGGAPGAPDSPWVDETSEQLVESQQLVVRLKELVREKDKELSNLKEQRDAVETRLSKVKLQSKARVASLTAQLEDLRRQSVSSLPDGSTQHDDYGKGVDGEGEQAAASRGKVRLLRRKADELEAVLAQCRTQLANTEAALATQRLRGSEMDAMLAERDRQLAEKEAFIVHLQVAGASPVISSAELQELQALKVQHTQSTAMVRDQAAMIKGLTRQVEGGEEARWLLQQQLERERRDWQQRQAAYDETVHKLQSFLREKEAAFHESLHKHEEALFQMESRIDASADMEQLLKSLKQKLHENEEVLAGRTQVVDMLQKEIDGRDQKILTLSESLSRLSAERVEMHGRLEAERHVFRAQLKDLRQRHPAVMAHTSSGPEPANAQALRDVSVDQQSLLIQLAETQAELERSKQLVFSLSLAEDGLHSPRPDVESNKKIGLESPEDEQKGCPTEGGDQGPGPAVEDCQFDQRTEENQARECDEIAATQHQVQLQTERSDSIVKTKEIGGFLEDLSKLQLDQGLLEEGGRTEKETDKDSGNLPRNEKAKLKFVQEAQSELLYLGQIQAQQEEGKDSKLTKQCISFEEFELLKASFEKKGQLLVSIEEDKAKQAKELESVKNELEEKNVEFSLLRRSLENNLESLRVTFSERELQCLSARDCEVNQLKERLSRAEEEITRHQAILITKNEGIEQFSANTRKEICALRSSKEEKDRENQLLKESLQQKEDEVRTLTGINQQKVQEVKDLQNSLCLKQQEIEEQTVHISAGREDIVFLKVSLQERDQDNELLNAQLSQKISSEKRLQEIISEKADQLDRVQKASVQREEDNRSLRITLTESEERIRLLKQNVLEKEEEVKTALSKLTNAEKSIKSLKDKGKNDKVNKKLKESCTLKEKELASLQVLLEEKDKTIVSLQNDCSVKSQDLDKLVNEVAAKDQQVSLLQQTLSEEEPLKVELVNKEKESFNLHDRLCKSNKEIEALKELVGEKENCNKSLTEQSNETERELIVFQEAVETTKQEVALYQEQLHHKDTHLSLLNQEVEVHRKDNTFLQGDLDTVRSEVVVLKTNLEQKKEEIMNLVEDTRERESEVSLLKSQVTEHLASIDLLKQEVKEQACSSEVLQNKLAEKEIECHTREENLTKLKEENCLLHSNLEEHLKETNLLKDNQVKTTQEVAFLQQSGLEKEMEVAKLKENLLEKESELCCIHEDIKRKDQEISNLNEITSSKTKEGESFLLEANKCKEKVVFLEEELEALRLSLSEKEANILEKDQLLSNSTCSNEEKDKQIATLSERMASEVGDHDGELRKCRMEIEKQAAVVKNRQEEQEMQIEALKEQLSHAAQALQDSESQYKLHLEAVESQLSKSLKAKNDLEVQICDAESRHGSEMEVLRATICALESRDTESEMVVVRLNDQVKMLEGKVEAMRSCTDHAEEEVRIMQRQLSEQAEAFVCLQSEERAVVVSEFQNDLKKSQESSLSATQERDTALLDLGALQKQLCEAALREEEFSEGMRVKEEVLRGMQAEAEKLQESLAASMDESRTKEVTLQGLHDRCQRQSEELRGAMTKVEALSAREALLQQALEQQEDEARRVTEALPTEQLLLVQLESLRNELGAKDGKVLASQKEVERLEHSLAEMQNQFQVVEVHARSLEDDLAQKKDRKGELEVQVSGLQAQLAAVITQPQAILEDLSGTGDLQENVDHAEEASGSLTQKQEEQKDQNKDLSVMEDLQKENLKAKSRIAEMVKEKEQIKKKLHAALLCRKELMQRVEELEHQPSVQHEECGKMAEGRIRELEENLVEKQHQLSEHQGHLDLFKQQLLDKESDIVVLSESLSLKDGFIEELQGKIYELNKSQTSLSSEIFNLKSALEAKETQVIEPMSTVESKKTCEDYSQTNPVPNEQKVVSTVQPVVSVQIGAGNEDAVDKSLQVLTTNEKDRLHKKLQAALLSRKEALKKTQQKDQQLQHQQKEQLDMQQRLKRQVQELDELNIKILELESLLEERQEVIWKLRCELHVKGGAQAVQGQQHDSTELVNDMEKVNDDTDGSNKIVTAACDKHACDEHQAKIEKLLQTVEEKDRVIEGIEDERKCQEDNFQRTKSESEIINSELKQEVMQKDELYRKLEEEMRSKEEVVEKTYFEYRSQVEELQQLLEKRDEECKKVQGEVINRQDLVEQMSAEYHAKTFDLQHQNDTKDQMYRQMEERMKSQEETFEKMCAEYETMACNFQQMLKVKEEVSIRLEKELQTKEVALETLSTKYEMQAQNLQQLMEQKEAKWKSVVEELQDKEKMFESTISQLEAEVQEQHETLDGKEEETAKRIEEFQSKEETFNKIIAEYQTQVEFLQKQQDEALETLMRKDDEMGDKVTVFETLIAKHQAEAQELRQDVEIKKEILRKFERGMQSKEGSMYITSPEHKSGIEEVEHEVETENLKRNEDNLQTIQSQSQNPKQQLEEKQLALDTLQKNFDEMVCQASETKVRLECLGNDLNELGREKAELLVKLSQSQEELQMKLKEASSLEAALNDDLRNVQEEWKLAEAELESVKLQLENVVQEKKPERIIAYEELETQVKRLQDERCILIQQLEDTKTENEAPVALKEIPEYNGVQPCAQDGQEIQSLMVERDCLQAAVYQKDSEIDCLALQVNKQNEMLDSKEASVVEKDALFRNLEEQTRHLQQQHEVEIQQLQIEMVELQQRHSTDDTVKEDNKEKDLNRKLQAALISRKDALKENKVLKDNVTTITKEKSELLNKTIVLDDSLIAAKKEIKSLSQQFTYAKKSHEEELCKVSILQSSILEATKEVEELAQKLRAGQEEKKKLISEVDHLLSVNNNLEASCDSLKLTVEAMAQEKQNLLQQVENDRYVQATQGQECQKKHEELMQDYETLLKSYENVGGEMERMRKTIEKVKQEKQEVLIQVQNFESEKQLLEKRVEEMQKESEKVTEKMRKFTKTKQQKIHDLEDEIDKLNQQCHELKGGRVTEEYSLEKELKLEEENNTLHTNVEELNEKLNVKREEAVCYEKEIERFGKLLEATKNICYDQEIQTEVYVNEVTVDDESSKTNMKNDEFVLQLEQQNSELQKKEEFLQILKDENATLTSRLEQLDTQRNAERLGNESSQKCSAEHENVLVDLTERVKILEDDKRVLQEELEGMQDAFDKVKNEKEPIELEMVTLRKKLETSEAAQDLLKHEKEELAYAAEKEHTQRQDIERQKENLEENLMNQMAQLNGLVGNYQEELSSFKQQYNELEAELQRVQKGAEEAEIQRAKDAQSRDGQMKETREYDEKLRSARFNENTRGGMNSELRELLCEKQLEIGQLQRDCMKYQQRLATLEKTVRALEVVRGEVQRELTEVKSAQRSSQDVIKRCENELAETRMALDDSRSAAAKAAAEAAHLSEELVRSEERLQMVVYRQRQEFLQKASEEAEKHQHELKELKDQCDRIRREKERADMAALEDRAAAGHKEQESVALRGRLDESLARLAAFARSMASLQDDRDRVIDETRLWETRFHDAIHKKEAELQVMETKCQQFQDEAREREAQFAEMKTRAENLTIRLSEVEVRLTEARAKLQKEREVQADLQQKADEEISEMSSSLHMAQSSVRQLDSDNAQLKSTVVHLEEERDTLSAARAHLETEVQKSAAEIRRLLTLCDEHRAELQVQQSLGERLESLIVSKDEEISQIMLTKAEEVADGIADAKHKSAEDLRERDERIAALVSAQEQAEQNKVQVEASLLELKDMMKNAVGERDERLSELEAFRKSMASLQEDRDRVASDYVALEVLHVKMLREKDELIQEAASEANGLRDEIRKLLAQADDLNGENAHLSARLTRYRDDLDAVLSLKDTQQKELLAKQMERIYALETKLAESEKKEQVLRGSLQEIQVQANALREEVELLKVAKEERDEHIVVQEKERELDSKEKDSRLSKLILHLKEVEAQCEDLKAKLEGCQSELKTAVDGSIQERDNAKKDLEHVEERHQKETVNFEQEITVLRSDMKTAQERVTELAQELLVSQQHWTQAEETATSLNEQLTSLKGAAASLQAERDRCETKNEAKDYELEKLEKVTTDLQDKDKMLQTMGVTKTAVHMSADHQILQQEVKNVASTADQQRQKVKSKQQNENSRKKDRLRTYKKQCTKLEKELEEMKNKFKEAEGQSAIEVQIVEERELQATRVFDKKIQMAEQQTKPKLQAGLQDKANEQVSEMSSSLLQAQSRVVQLDSDTVQLKSTVVQLEEERDTLFAVRAHLETEVQKSVVEMQNAMTVCEELRAELKVQQSLSEQLQSSIASKDEEISQIMLTKAEELADGIADAKHKCAEDVRERDERIAALVSAREQAEQNKVQVETSVLELEDMLKNVVGERDERLSELEAFRKSMASLQEDRDRVASDYVALEALHVKMLSEKDELIQEAAAEANRLREEIRKLLGQADDLNGVNSHLSAQLTQYRDDLDAVLSLKDTQQKELLAKRTERICALETSLEESEHEEQALRHSLEQLQEKANALREEVELLKASKEELNEQLLVKAKKTEIEKAEKDSSLSKVTQRLQETESMCEGLEAELNECQNEMQACKEQSAKLEKELEDVRKVAKEKEDQIAREVKIVEENQLKANQLFDIKLQSARQDCTNMIGGDCELRELLRVKQLEIGKFQRDSVKYQQQFSKMEETIKAVEFARNEVQDELKEMKSVLYTSEEEIKRYKYELAENQRALDGSRSAAAKAAEEASLEIKELVRSKEQLQTVMQQQQQDMAHQVAAEAEKHQAELVELKDHCDKIGQEKERANQVAIENRAAAGHKEQEVVELRGRLDESLARLAAFTCSMASLQDDRDRVLVETRLWETRFHDAVRNKEAEVQVMETKCKICQDEVKEREAQLLEMKTHAENLTTSQHDAEVKLTEARAELQNERKVQASLQDKADEQISEMSSSLLQAQSRVVQLNSDNVQLKSTVVQLEEERDTLFSARAHLETEVQKSAVEMQNAMSVGEELRAELKVQQSLSEQLQSSIASKDEEISQIMLTKAEELADGIADAKHKCAEDVRERDERIAALVSAREQAEQNKVQVETSVLELEDMLKNVVGERDERLSELEAFRKSMASLQEDRDRVASDYVALEALHVKMLSEKDELIQAAAAEANRLREEIRKLLGQADDLNGVNSHLSAQLTQYRDDLDAVLSLKDTQQKELLAKRTERICALERSLEESEHKEQALRHSLEQLQEKANALREEVELLKASKEELNEQLLVKEKKTEIEKAEKDSSLSKVTQRLQDTESMCEGLEAELNECQNEMQACKEQSAKLEKELEDVRKIAKEKEDQIAREVKIVEENQLKANQLFDIKLQSARQDCTNMIGGDCELRELLRVKQLEIGKFQRDSVKYQQQFSKMEETIKAVEFARNEVQDELKEMKSVLYTSEEEIKRYKYELAENQRALDGSRSAAAKAAEEASLEIKELVRSKEQLQTVMQQQQQDMAHQVAAEAEKHQAELVELKDHCDKIGQEKERANQVAIENRAAAGHKEQEVVELRGRLDESLARLAAFTCSMASLQGDRDRVLVETRLWETRFHDAVRNKEAEVQVMETKCKICQDEVKEREAQLLEMKTHAENLTTSQHDAEVKLTEARAELQNERKAQASLQDKANEQISEMSSSLLQAQSRVVQLDSDNVQLKSTVVQLEEERDTLFAAHAHLETEVQKSVVEMQNAMSVGEELRAELKVQQSLSEQLQSSIASKDEEMSQIMLTKAEELADGIADAKHKCAEDVRERDERIAALVSAREQAEQNKVQVETSVLELEDMLKNVVGERDEQLSELEAFRKSMASLQEDRDRVASDYVALEALHVKMLSEKDELIQEAAAEANRLRDEIRKLLGQADDLNGVNSHLSAQLTQYRDDLDAVLSLKDTQQKELLAKWTERICALETSLEESEHKEQALRHSLEQLQVQANALREEVELLKASKDELDKELLAKEKKTEMEKAEKESSLSKVTQRLQVAESNCKGLNGELNGCRNQMQAAVDGAARARQDAEEELSKMQEHYKQDALKLGHEMGVLRAETETAQERVAELAQELLTSEQRCAQAEESATVLREELMSMKLALASLQAERDRQENGTMRATHHEEETRSLENALAALGSEKNKLMLKLEHLQSVETHRTEAGTRQENELVEIYKEREALRSELAALHERHTREVSAYQAEIVVLRSDKQVTLSESHVLRERLVGIENSHESPTDSEHLVEITSARKVKAELERCLQELHQKDSRFQRVHSKLLQVVEEKNTLTGQLKNVGRSLKEAQQRYAELQLQAQHGLLQQEHETISFPSRQPQNATQYENRGPPGAPQELLAEDYGDIVELQKRLIETEQLQDVSQLELARLAEGLREECQRRKAAEDALQELEGHIKRLEGEARHLPVQDHTSLIMEPLETERDALLPPLNEQHVLRRAKSSTLWSCLRWLQVRSSRPMRLRLARFVFLFYLLAIHIVVFTCLLGH